MPPYRLPDEKTKTVLFKSNTSSHGGGHNEIRIEDSAASEQIYIHGEKDLDVRIRTRCASRSGATSTHRRWQHEREVGGTGIRRPG